MADMTAREALLEAMGSFFCLDDADNAIKLLASHGFVIVPKVATKEMLTPIAREGSWTRFEPSDLVFAQKVWRDVIAAYEAQQGEKR